jgi:hypothetical protein
MNVNQNRGIGNPYCQPFVSHAISLKFSAGLPLTNRGKKSRGESKSPSSSHLSRLFLF